MQKILVILVTIFSVSVQVQAADDNICFECTYLAQSMRLTPTGCREAQEALSGFDEQANRLHSLYPEWTREFVRDNRDILIKHMNRLCQKHVWPAKPRHMAGF